MGTYFVIYDPLGKNDTEPRGRLRRDGKFFLIPSARTFWEVAFLELNDQIDTTPIHLCLTSETPVSICSSYLL